MKNLLLIVLLFTMPVLAKAQGDAEVKKVTLPKGFTEQLDVVYTTVDGWQGKMDLYLPPKENDPSPVVINIHGGGWNKGNKESQTGFSSFFKKGYAVARISYRLSPVATAPAAIEDARCALAYIVNNAKALNIDPDKIVVMGTSAGAHLALMAGLADNARFDRDCKTKKPVKVAAIIDKYGITDVKAWPSKSATQWLGDKANDEAFARSVSPLYNIKKNSPPVFIVHGDADPTVAYQQSLDLKAVLDKAGIKNKMITIPGGQHGKFAKEQNTMVNNEIMDFLKDIGVHEK